MNFLNLYFTDKHGSQSFSLYDEKSKISISANYSVIPEDAKLVVETITEGEKYNNIKSILGNTASKIYSYNLALMQDKVEIQPKDELTIFFPILNDIDTSKIEIYRVTEKSEKIEHDVMVKIVDNVKYAVFETDHFSIYVLGQKI